MGSISLLDCTLRDGGYLNDWRFGRSAIPEMVQQLSRTGVEILELGFLKAESYEPDRTVFSREEQMEALIRPKQPGMLYAGMVEVMNPLPIDDLVPCSESTIDIIRVIVWKRLLLEGLEYCRQIAAKGYKVFVQPARVNQYTDAEFVDMIKLFNPLKPMALYVVDSWGTQSREDILKYVHLADKHLDTEIALGYHGHNNLQQASSCAEAFACSGLRRDIVIDASIYGIGRGAGNLNLELFASYLNRVHGKAYQIAPMLAVFDEFVKPIFETTPWGYSIPHFLTAQFDCNPEYASYLAHERGLPVGLISDILGRLSTNEKLIFSPDAVAKYL